MIANSDGVAPAGGLALYRRAMMSQSESFCNDDATRRLAAWLIQILKMH
jgi:hypothetical protein